MLDEVHLFADGSFSDDVVARLEDLESQFGQHGGDEVGVSVGEEGHGGHQFATVKVDDFLQRGTQNKVSLQRRHDVCVASCVHFNHCKSRVVNSLVLLMRFSVLIQSPAITNQIT